MASYDAQKTHCKNGHLFDEANTHFNQLGHRGCRACHRIREAARRAQLPQFDPWKNAIDRFWSRVVKSSDCWIFNPGTKSARKTISIGNRGWAASRFSWTIHNGPIPDGMFVCHHCDNPPCVRPDHLFLGTAADNTADMMTKGRARMGPLPVHRGVDNPSAKLDPDKVREMRRLRSEGWEYRPIAKKFGVTPRAAWLAVTGGTWSHVA